MTRLKFAVIAVGMLLASMLAQTAMAADAILLDFSSAHCAPCQAMKPILAQLEQQGTPIRHVDVVSEPYLAARYGIRKTPTFVVLSGGKEVTRLVGTQSFEELRTALSIDPSGPLIHTESKMGPRADLNNAITAPETRLAPIGGGPPARVESPAALSATTEQTLVAMTATEATSEPMPSVSLADAVERARAATVRLRVHDGHGYGAGTGTIIDTHGDEALVLTCGHLFRETKGQGKIEVDLFVGGEVRTVLGQVIDYDADTRDVALVAIRPGFAVQPVDLISANQQVRNGETAFSFGCDRGDDPSRRDTRITGVNKYNQHLGVSNLEIAGAPIDGRSGGGLFDQNGRLIGVCNAADYQEDVGIYAGPGSVHWQLDRVGLSQLYQRGASVAAAGTTPATRLAGLDHSAAPASAPTAQPAATMGNLATLDPPAAPTRLADPSVTQTSSSALNGAGRVGQEVIVIVRDPNHPQGSPQVMTLQQPSAELMQLIRQQAVN